jgi:thiamine-monophosphate kinase
MEQPQPRVALGLALRGIASAAIDLSDGLLGDLGHVLRRSGCGATLQLDALPRSALLAAQPAALQRTCLLTGGDDYELLLAAPPERHADMRAVAARTGVPLSCVGRVTPADQGLRVLDAQGQPLDLQGLVAFDHFK